MPEKNQAGGPATTGAAARNVVSTYIFPTWSWSIWVSVLGWATIFIAIPPARQNFPLGDDWAFAHGAIWFAQGKGIHYSGWASMLELGQWIWSCPFLSVIGLSHVALRVSVIVLSWPGLAGFYDLLRQEGIAPRTASFAASVLALNPLYFISSGTYMTDVPALAFGLLALAFYQRAFAKKDLRWLLAAVLLALFAVTTRQTMLAVPVAAGFLLLRHPEIRWKPVWILSLVLPMAACGYAGWWFSSRPDIVPMKPIFDPDEIVFRPYLALHWCGLVMLPLFFLVSRPHNWRNFFLCFVAVMLAAAFLCFLCDGMPYGGLFPYCTGMLSLCGTFTEGLVVGQRDVLIGLDWRIIITILGCLGAAKILVLLLEAIRARKTPGVLLVFTAVQFFIMLTTPGVADRYLEVLFPGMIFLVASRCSASGPGWPAGVAVLLLYGLLSVALMHDWLSWNSARWELGRRAVASQNIQPVDIEGGFEWNGWYATADPARPLKPRRLSLVKDDGTTLALHFTRSYFPDVTGQFALAFTEPVNAVTVASLPYSAWLPPAKKKFLLVRTQPAQ